MSTICFEFDEKMKEVLRSEITTIKMTVNPPQCVVDAGFRIIHDNRIKHWVGIGWVEEREATKDDYNVIPSVND